MSEDDVDNLIDWAEVGSLNYARSIVRKNAELERENAKLKQQLQAMARLLKALPHDPTTEGMLHRDY